MTAITSTINVSEGVMGITDSKKYNTKESFITVVEWSALFNGHYITMWLPSMAPKQCGKFHFIYNSSLIAFHSWECGGGLYQFMEVSLFLFLSKNISHPTKPLSVYKFLFNLVPRVPYPTAWAVRWETLGTRLVLVLVANYQPIRLRSQANS